MLSEMLSQLLVAYTIAYDNEFEHHMPHRTATYGVAGPPSVVPPSGAPVRGPWLCSLVMWSNFMRYVRPEGVPLGVLQRMPANLAGLQRWGYVVVQPPEGARAASASAKPQPDWLVKATGGKGKIIELEGSTGASAANDRKKGFDDVIAKNPGMQIVASQSGDFARDTGRKVMETLLQAHPDVTAVYAHNDEMALGAIAAIKAAGKQPGKDITIVTIDGTKGGMDAIAAGELGASVQSSPFFGPLACDVAQKFAKGETVPPWVKVSDRFYDKSNVKESMQYGY